MFRKGDWVKVKINYPRNPKINGVYSGIITKIGQYRGGYVYFKLDTYPNLSFPNSSKYVQVIDRRSGVNLRAV